MKYTVYEGSRKGGRQANEDRVGYAFTNESLVLALADGMGGHLRGDLAAEILIREVLRMFRDMARPDLPNCAEFLLDAIYAAHAAINEFALQKRMKDPPRTTCVVCVMQHDKAWWAHVGDSRLYHFSDNRLVARTLDHSAVQQLVSNGLLDEADMNKHPERNKLLNGLGGYILPNIELSDEVHLNMGDVILICSDGFWSNLDTESMISTLRAHPLRDAASLLMDQSEEVAGGQGDNLSVVAMRYGPDVFEGAELEGAKTDLVDGFTTELNWLAGREHAEFRDLDINKAIEEIRLALDRSNLKKGNGS